jgi:hypothetical protein
MARPATERQRENEAARPEGGTTRGGTAGERRQAERQERANAEIEKILADPDLSEEQKAARVSATLVGTAFDNARTSNVSETSAQQANDHLVEVFSGWDTLKPAERHAMRRAARGLMARNDLDPESAAETLNLLFDVDTPVQFTSDGRISIDGGQPLFIDGTIARAILDLRTPVAPAPTEEAPTPDGSPPATQGTMTPRQSGIVGRESRGNPPFNPQTDPLIPEDAPIRRLQRGTSRDEEGRARLRAQLESGLISQEQYDAAIARMDRRN